MHKRCSKPPQMPRYIVLAALAGFARAAKCLPLSKARYALLSPCFPVNLPWQPSEPSRRCQYCLVSQPYCSLSQHACLLSLRTDCQRRFVLFLSLLHTCSKIPLSTSHLFPAGFEYPARPHTGGWYSPARTESVWRWHSANQKVPLRHSLP